jgi:hypothetical protein
MINEKLFQGNLKLWAKTCPKQALMLPYIDTSKVEVCQTQKGEENLKVMIHNKKLFLHAEKGAVEEAKRWSEELPLKGILLVFVYGVGLGYYYDAIRLWLKKNKHHRIVFLEDDLAVIHKLLETESGTKILQDPQVQLLYFNDLKADEEIFENLYWNFAMRRLAVTSLQSYEKAKSINFDELRHKIAFDAAMKNALVDEYLRYGINYYINFYQNLLYLDKSYLGNHFFGKFHKVPAIICGAGPSLAKNIQFLKQSLDKAIVFAGGSSLNVLNAAGFQPHFGAGIDPNPAQFTRLSQNTAYEVPFFYRNRMNHDAFQMIHGPRLYITGSGGYDTAEYVEKKLGINSNAEIDEGHNVVNFCVEVAHAMGCDPIIFVGMDLAYTEMSGYAPGVVVDAEVSHSAILDIENQDAKAILKTDIHGKPTYTLWKWLAESEWIGKYAKEHPLITMINCTEGGIGFPGIENLTLLEILQTRLKRSYEFGNRIHGETQNAVISKISKKKIVKVMNELKSSLQRTMENIQVLLQDTEANTQKIKEGELGLIQSGRAVLAETDLVEEPGYKFVLEVFNEVFSHLLSSDLHEINVHKYSEKQRQLKKLELSRKKFVFLSNVAKVNEELLTLALEKLKNQKNQKKRIKIEAEPPMFDPGIYQINDGRMILSDLECNLDFDKKFNPVKVPLIREDGRSLGNGYVLRVFYDSHWKLNECYVEKAEKLNGQALLFYSDGNIKSENYYLNGKLHGPSKFWNPQGTLLAESYFVDGLHEGKMVWFYPSGALYSLQRYQNGVWHGPQEYYYENGILKTLMYYEKGKLIDMPFLQLSNGTQEPLRRDKGT